jgi:hypothetical protein
MAMLTNQINYKWYSLMVENFEEITKPLSTDDLKLLPILMEGLKRRSEHNPVSSKEIMRGVNARIKEYGVKSKLSGAKLRKMVNYIRVNSLLPVMANSVGYYVSEDPEVIASQVRSLRDRAKGIEAAAAGLESFLKPKPEFIQATLFT